MTERTAIEMENAINERGLYLRDDGAIREGLDCFKGIEEAYSLHKTNPFRRLHVFGGPKCWAIEQAYELVFHQANRLPDWYLRGDA